MLLVVSSSAIASKSETSNHNLFLLLPSLLLDAG
jgi:hypothetical protein